MAKVNYVACPSCNREYYTDHILSEAIERNPDQPLKCPFCKTVFNFGAKPRADKPKAASAAASR